MQKLSCFKDRTASTRSINTYIQYIVHSALYTQVGVYCNILLDPLLCVNNLEVQPSVVTRSNVDRTKRSITNRRLSSHKTIYSACIGDTVLGIWTDPGAVYASKPRAYKAVIIIHGMTMLYTVNVVPIQLLFRPEIQFYVTFLCRSCKPQIGTTKGRQVVRSTKHRRRKRMLKIRSVVCYVICFCFGWLQFPSSQTRIAEWRRRQISSRVYTCYGICFIQHMYTRTNKQTNVLQRKQVEYFAILRRTFFYASSPGGRRLHTLIEREWDTTNVHMSTIITSFLRRTDRQTDFQTRFGKK